MYFVKADDPEGPWSEPVRVNDPSSLPYGLGYDNSIFIDDGTGTAQVLLGSDITQEITENQLVRVFGRVIPSGDGFDISAEIIQDMKNLNIKLYTTVMNYYNKLA